MEINVVKLKEYAAECKVLYVEDDEIIRQQTNDFLSRFFQNITLAENGKEGLDKYQNGSYDIIITDINMPVMNGIEMIEAIRDENPEQIILVTSAYNDSDNLIKLINLGIMRFVLKPFNNKQFIIMLYQIVEELHLKRIHEKIQQQAEEAQQLIDLLENGIIIIKNGTVSMTNKAFLTMVGYEDFETLKIELPEIGAMFQACTHCIDAQTNLELIEQLQFLPDEEHVIRLEHNGELREYQISYTSLEGDERYALVFTDITAIHDAMHKDEHTKLPLRRFVLEQIEAYKMTNNTLPALLISVKNFSNVLQWYGKGNAIAVEKETSQLLQSIVYTVSPKSFLGYFGQNQFILLSGNFNAETITEKLHEVTFAHNAQIKESHVRTDIDFHLSIESTLLELDCNKSTDELEIDIINGYEALDVKWSK